VELTLVLPANKTTIVVIDQRVLIRDCLARCLRAVNDDYVVLAFASVAEWQQAASNHPPASVIMLGTRGRKPAEMEIGRDLSTLSRAEVGVPVVLISDVEDAEHVLMALDYGAKGYIPTSVTLDVAVEAMRLVGVGGMFVPASSLISSRRTMESASSPKSHCDGVFTARQAAVVEALRRGKANKIIAYELNMRESTVKVHVRNIMKKLQARNRTEVAFLTNGIFENAHRN
jgi:DNA-binding NarL/FixJ family response regulator